MVVGGRQPWAAGLQPQEAGAELRQGGHGEASVRRRRPSEGRSAGLCRTPVQVFDRLPDWDRSLNISEFHGFLVFTGEMVKTLRIIVWLRNNWLLRSDHSKNW